MPLLEARNTPDIHRVHQEALDSEQLLPLLRALRGGREKAGFDELLATLGETLRLGVAFLFQVVERSSDTFIETRSVWLPGSSDSGTHVQVRIAMEKSGLRRWIPMLLKQQGLFGSTDILPLSEQAFLGARGIGSLMLLPVQHRDAWWGFLLLGDGAAGREWSRSDRALGEVSAELIGLGVSREELRDQLDGRTQEMLELARVRDGVTRELQEVKAWKEKVFSTFSHEFLTPLNTLMGFSSTLIEYDQLDEDREVRKVCLRNIHEQSQRLKKLVNDILVASSLQSRLSMVDTRPLDIRALVLELCSVFLRRARRDDIDFSHRLGDAPLGVCTEAVLIRQLLFNLLDNALKSTPVGGWMTLNAEVTDAAVVIKITDSGSAIAPEQLEHLFEPFYPPAYQNSAEYDTHLSLSISKQIVDLHGGSITVDSRHGAGTVFTVMLPSCAL